MRNVARDSVAVFRRTAAGAIETHPRHPWYNTRDRRRGPSRRNSSPRGPFMRLILPAVLLGAAAVVFGLSGRAAPGDKDAEKPDVDKLNKKVSFSLATAEGKAFDSTAIKDKKAIVVVFLSFDCPVSNGYASTLIDIHKRYSSKGVAFVAINASDDLSAKDVVKKAKEYDLPFTALKDDKFKAADAFQARIAPEAFVL